MENKFELIEKYLMNEMSVREEVEFEEILKNDPELMSEFKLRKEINNAIIEEDILSLRNKINNIIVENKSLSLKLKTSIIYSSAAAVLVLFIVVAGINIFPIKNSSNSEIFHEYYSPYPAIMGFRSLSEKTEIENLLCEAFNSYDEENYVVASDYFEEVLILENENIMSQFYLSICEIEKDNFEKAKEHLQEILVNKDHIFVNQSIWYLAMVNLKLDKLNEAKMLLEEIIRENMKQKKDAEAILKGIN